MKPFLQGKKTIALPALHIPSAVGIAQARPRPASTAGHELTELGAVPTVEVVKEGDKVARLIVTCSCGQKIEVDCIYPAG